MENNKTIGQKILGFSFTKIIIGLFACVGIVSVAQIGIHALLETTGLQKEYQNLIGGSLVAILALFVYTTLYKFYEKRKITELSTNKLARNISMGVVLGALLQSLTIFVMYVNGAFSIISVNSFVSVLPALTMAFTAAIFEEILFRGIIFRITEEKLGSYLSLVISALLFGLLHIANPNSSLTVALGIAIQAGLLLGAAYIYSRNLWLPIALHFAWNFTQSGIYGAATSGNEIHASLLTTKTQGAEMITGGQFGPEGSIQATLFCLAAAIILMILNHKQNKIIKPVWKTIDEKDNIILLPIK
jgi:membrane protease YdiL (CAAX protease family)